MARSKYDGAEIQVVKWVEYQNRSDGKTHKWFKLDNDIAIGPALHGMNCEHKWLLIFILSMTAKKLGSAFTWNSDYVESVTGIKAKTQDQAIDILVTKGTVKTNFNLVQLSSTNFQSTCLEEKRREEKRREESAAELVAESKLHWLAESWNQLSGDLPKVQECSTGRMKHIRARLEEHSDEGYWRGVIARIQASPFCNGKNDRVWKADFDWLLKPDTGAKVLEGKYDQRGAPGAPDRKAEQERQEHRDRLMREAGLESA